MKRGRGDAPAARLAISDELGLLKVVGIPRGPTWASSQVVQTWGRPDKNAAIQGLAAPNYLLTDADVLAVSRIGGSIQLLDTAAGQLLSTLPPHKPQASPAPTTNTQRQHAARDREVKCLAFRQLSASSSSSSAPLELVSCTVGGTLRMHRQQHQQQQPLEAEEEEQDAGPDSRGQAWDEVIAFQAGPNVSCMALDPSQSHIAVGGDGCHLRVWSLDQRQEIFKAKGGKPGRSGLVDLPHLTAVTYFSDPSNQLVVAGTMKHKLWLYDMRAGKRPQIDMEWGDARVTALVADPDGLVPAKVGRCSTGSGAGHVTACRFALVRGAGQRVWAANGQGRIEGVDLRARAMRGCLKGPAGSIRSLALHPEFSSPCSSGGSLLSPGHGNLMGSSPLMASVGLDRFLRVHSTAAGQQALSKVYLKQQLTGVVWLRPDASQVAVREEAEEREDKATQSNAQAREELIQPPPGSAKKKKKELKSDKASSSKSNADRKEQKGKKPREQ